MRVARHDPLYPPRLADRPSPPEAVWIDGDATALTGPSAAGAIAIVGTRRMTPYGERVARELAIAAARAGRVVVSGLAVGIDSAAHAGALDGGGRTVAVLGEGLRAFAPHGRRRRLAARIVASGCLVSLFPPLFAARRWTFAERNATIAALASAVVVIEAPEGSGALITAADARAMGRPLYAVPGPLGSSASAGTNALIANGYARVLLGPGSLGLGAPAAASDPLLERLAAGALSPDVLGADVARVAELLLEGRIVVLPDGRIARRAE